MCLCVANCVLAVLYGVQIFEVNVKSAALLVKEAYPHLVASE